MSFPVSLLEREILRDFVPKMCRLRGPEACAVAFDSAGRQCTSTG
jgi:hypothetical protein